MILIDLEERDSPRYSDRVDDALRKLIADERYTQYFPSGEMWEFELSKTRKVRALTEGAQEEEITESSITKVTVLYEFDNTQDEAVGKKES